MTRTNPLRLLARCLAPALLAGCASGEPRFPLRDPVWQDGDLQPVWARCHREPTPKEPEHVSCAPALDPNPLIWDGADNLVFRPLSETLGVVVGGEAVDVNSLDEVPDSSWFANRIGVRPMRVEQIALGACTPGLLLDGTTATDGTWVIDKGKGDGSTDGFRVNVPGHGKYLFKADDLDTPEHASAAQSLGARAYYAAGYNTSCEQVVYFRRAALRLTPGLKWKHNFGDEEPFGAKELDAILNHCAKRGVWIRMQASAWIVGANLGGFRYQGTRSDDPNDVVAHEDRRELRAKRLLDAWIDRFDDRRGNTLDLWVSARQGTPDASPGHVVHYSMDTSEALGSTWKWDEISRRLGYTYVFDWGELATDFVTLGTRVNTWDTVKMVPGKELFAYFNVKDFVPDAWKNEYPIAAFSRMTERDAAWMARVLARFTPATVNALVGSASFTDPADSAYLEDVLEGRLHKILERYLTRLSPIAEVHVEGGDELCAIDLAEGRGLREPTAFRYVARRLGGSWLNVERRPEAGLCVHLTHTAPDGRSADDDRARYLRVRMEDGVARGPLVVHLYDLGPSRGFRLAGLERPDR
jgi:hypothetical protein